MFNKHSPMEEEKTKVFFGLEFLSNLHQKLKAIPGCVLRASLHLTRVYTLHAITRAVSEGLDTVRSLGSRLSFWCDGELSFDTTVAGFDRSGGAPCGAHNSSRWLTADKARRVICCDLICW